MYLFLLLFLPSLLALYFVYTKNSKLILAVLIGIISAALLCAYKGFISYMHRVVPYSFMENFLVYFFQETFIPILVLCGIYFFLSKDEISFKIDSFFPMMGSFYAIYIPFLTLCLSKANTTPFVLFVKPCLYGMMLIQCYVSFLLVLKYKEEKNVLRIITSVLIILISILLPAVAESLYIINNKIGLSFLICLISILLTGLYIIVNRKVFREQ
ncbi:MAG: hypothetical protein GX677_06635 [Treponema sp.]|jgi:hypothetical protein|nr:hypothetical protein [Treponema sp.]